MANSRNAGRVYLGSRFWSLFNDALDPADKDLLINFVSAAPGLLRELYDLGIDPAEVYALCLKTAPRHDDWPPRTRDPALRTRRQDDWPASRTRHVEAGRKLLDETITWLRTTANAVPPDAIPPDAISVGIPGPGESVVAKPDVPLNPALFAEMLATIQEIRTDKASTNEYEREPWPPAPKERIRYISLPPFKVDPTLVLQLEALKQQLEAISAMHRRSRGAPRQQLETSFIRGFTRLARQKTKKPLDALGADLFAIVFSRRLDPEAYTRRRTELEAPSNRRGALGRAVAFLQRELAAGRQPILDLISRASVLDVSRTTLFRAANKLGLNTTRTNGVVYWSLPKLPRASTGRTKRN